MGKHTENELHIELSNRKENILQNQLNNVFRPEGKTDHEGRELPSGGINHMGESRYQRTQDIMSQNPHATPSQKACGVGITSFSTLHNTQSKCHTFGAYAFAECGVKSLADIKPVHVAQFLGDIIERGYNVKTVKAYCSAIQHLDTALSNLYPQNRGDWQGVVADFRDYANEVSPHTPQDVRAYTNPQAVIENISDERVRFGAELSLNYGLRQNEVCHNVKISDSQIMFNQKGGMSITKELTPAQMKEYDRLFPSGSMSIKVDHYAYELKKGCMSAGENWTGTHALRHNFAVEDYNKYRSAGYSDIDSKALVSRDMGHCRPEITEVYLR